MIRHEVFRVHVGEKQLLCPFCGQDEFLPREIKLNTSGMSFLGLDWANRSAEGLVCRNCGRIEMFLSEELRKTPV